jgi:hypothetical protein
MLPDPKQLYLRHWWWSPKPFYLYEDARKCGWGHFVDVHPGLFNLAWAAAGGPLPPVDYTPYADDSLWVVQEAAHIKMGQGLTMADWAFVSTLPEFIKILSCDEKARRYKFVTKGASMDIILKTLKRTALARA